MAVAPVLKLTMADGCLSTLPASFGSKTSTHCLIPFRKKPIRFLRLSGSCFSLSFTPFVLSLEKKKVPLAVSLVARTSDWARQDEEAAERGVGEEDFEWESETKESGLSEGEGPEAGFSDWEKEDREGTNVVGDVIAEGDSPVNEGFLEGGDDSFPEPPEEAKLFVGNLPYDMDSEKLAHLFEKAGIVEVAEVLYNRETGQSRGFGFVNMSNVEEAEKAVELFHRYDCSGRLLTVNKASPRGSLPERAPREFEPSSVRIYVGNLPWQVDDARLEQVFSEHGKVLNARVVYDRETGRSRGFGFVTMASKSEHDDAIEALDGQTLDGRAIRVNVAEERPRRGSF